MKIDFSGVPSMGEVEKIIKDAIVDIKKEKEELVEIIKKYVDCDKIEPNHLETMLLEIVLWKDREVKKTHGITVMALKEILEGIEDNENTG